jgi:hypothetical protein
MSNSETENRRDYLVHLWQNRYMLEQSILRKPINRVFMKQWAEFMADLERGPLDLGTNSHDKPGGV